MDPYRTPRRITNDLVVSVVSLVFHSLLSKGIRSNLITLKAM